MESSSGIFSPRFDMPSSASRKSVKRASLVPGKDTDEKKLHKDSPRGRTKLVQSAAERKLQFSPRDQHSPRDDKGHRSPRESREHERSRSPRSKEKKENRRESKAISPEKERHKKEKDKEKDEKKYSEQDKDKKDEKKDKEKERPKEDRKDKQKEKQTRRSVKHNFSLEKDKEKGKEKEEKRGASSENEHLRRSHSPRSTSKQAERASNAAASVSPAPATASAAAPPKIAVQDAEAEKLIDKREQHRQMVLNELETTERDYLNDLEVLIDVYLKPIRERGLLDQQDISAIFSNVEQLLILNQDFFSKYQELKKSSEGGDLPIGSLFFKSAELFKIYGMYFTNQNLCTSTLERCKSENSAFSRFLEEAAMHPKCRGLGIFSFLIKPVQRICKYPLLLRELVKLTPEEHPDYKMLCEAEKKIESLVAYLNERKKVLESQQKIVELVNSVDGIDPNTLQVPPGYVRVWIIESQLAISKDWNSKHPKLHKVVLFNDIIVYVKNKERNKKPYVFKGIIPLCSSTRIIDVQDTPDRTNQFIISINSDSPQNQRLIFQCANVDEKKKWMREVKQILMEAIKREAQNRRSEAIATAAADDSAVSGARSSDAPPVVPSGPGLTRTGSQYGLKLHLASSPGTSPVLPKRASDSPASAAAASPTHAATNTEPVPAAKPAPVEMPRILRGNNAASLPPPPSLVVPSAQGAAAPATALRGSTSGGGPAARSLPSPPVVWIRHDALPPLPATPPPTNPPPLPEGSPGRPTFALSRKSTGEGISPLRNDSTPPALPPEEEPAEGDSESSTPQGSHRGRAKLSKQAQDAASSPAPAWPRVAPSSAGSSPARPPRIGVPAKETESRSRPVSGPATPSAPAASAPGTLPFAVKVKPVPKGV